MKSLRLASHRKSHSINIPKQNHLQIPSMSSPQSPHSNKSNPFSPKHHSILVAPSPSKHNIHSISIAEAPQIVENLVNTP